MHCYHNPITRLVATLSRRTHMYFERQLRAQGLSFTQTRMLSFLAEHPGSRQEDLRAYVDIDKGGAAHAVRRLVELGYVQRRPDPADGRVRLLDLTASGRTVVAEFQEVVRTWNDALIADLSAEEQTLAERLLQRMADNATALLDEDCKVIG
ncbi:MarR family winged helix-turn-helix transcriptional regulator [Anaerosoma tenue]|uniref:MarR family winged helix-turn-helix transcriptional regulator n=1 Tax=Anaerosoma tenue TaxID=2933588 RepID=UPI002260E360|nr:MarR family transcriptional regulator [Anaerosoma tenue]MCK8115094.1 MarR family transcriptional regulator [Anaerosoma tenue]